MDRRLMMKATGLGALLLAAPTYAQASQITTSRMTTFSDLVSQQGGLRATSSDEAYLVFEAIEKIPDNVIRLGESAANKWIRDYVSNNYTPNQQFSRLNQPQVNWAGCIGAVGLALMENLIPIFKITKLKAFFKSIGGVKTFINAYSHAYQRLRSYGLRGADLAKRAAVSAAHQAGPEVKEALLSIFGIATLVGACTDW